MVDSAVAVAGSLQQPQLTVHLHHAGLEPGAAMIDGAVAVAGSLQQPLLTVYLTPPRTGAWSSGG